MFLLCSQKLAAVPTLWCTWAFPSVFALSCLACQGVSHQCPECEDTEGNTGDEPLWLLPVAAEVLRQLSEQLQPRPLPPQGPQSPLCSPSKRSLPSWTSAALMETTTLYVPLPASLIICKASRIGLLLCSLLTCLWVAKSLVWGVGPRSLPVLLLLDELHSLGKSILFSLSFKFFVQEIG